MFGPRLSLVFPLVLLVGRTSAFFGAAFAPTSQTIGGSTLIGRYGYLHQPKSSTLTTTSRKPPFHAIPRNQVSRLTAASKNEEPALDRILASLTSGFPFFVLASALVGLGRPSLLTWVNHGDIISLMLASVMCGTGLTLETKDFTNVLQKDRASVPLGVLCQFIIMPFAAWVVGTFLLLPNSSIGPALFLGLCLVGCSPGGTASNLVALIAQADVALSVILTACSTLLAVVMTPLLVKLLVGSSIRVSGLALCQATARVVLGPVLLGMILNAKLPRLARALSRFTPFASVLLVSLICGGVVAQNTALILSSEGVRSLILAILLLHALGFCAGYWIPKAVFGREERSARTISIEVGMQNSALAVVLARSIGAPALASLPGALSATAHSCLGSILAAVWRIRDGQKKKKESSSSNPADGEIEEDYSI